MKLELYMKSGHVVVADATSVTKKTNQLTGALQGLEWQSEPSEIGARRNLLHVDLSDLSALVVVHEETDEPAAEGVVSP
jgi:hypothetical protein